ncbi:MAG: hypothetical protein AUF76_05655 [Acidobacteria bacterium 13_1_20CM_2_65_9]|nr:MAG: hypothetical protein AUF76_05655 [Acidobacteria bacterium 13_1_20CM_2_65_9]
MTTLHITNGDCAANTLRQFLTDPVSITADVLHEGPAPRVDLETWHQLRARFLTPSDHASFEDLRNDLARSDRTIAEVDRYDEVVLWFEHDLFDQLLVIRTLDLLGGPDRLRQGYGGPLKLYADAERAALRQTTKTRVSLICIDRFPGVERFVGLGQLDAEQLASLVETRRPVTDEQYALATNAWDAFRAPDPVALINMRQTDALPFLAGALKRFLEEYPSTTNGLSRTADAVLRELDAGPRSAHDLFVATQAREERPFMGDGGFFDIVHQLARARVPLVTIVPRDAGQGAANDSERDLRAHTIALTDAGRDVLNGLDVWRGGVHLVAAGGDDRSPWRWDARRETLV